MRTLRVLCVVALLFSSGFVSASDYSVTLGVDGLVAESNVFNLLDSPLFSRGVGFTNREFMSEVLLPLFLAAKSIGGVSREGYEVTEIKVDMFVYQRYISAHGVLVSRENKWIPATGTCFFTADGGVYCGLQAFEMSLIIDLDSSFNSGQVTLLDHDGRTIGSGSISEVRVH